MDTEGHNVVDFIAFMGRWSVGENTFKPPYFHRNYATEFSAIVSIDEPCTCPLCVGVLQAGRVASWAWGRGGGGWLQHGPRSHASGADGPGCTDAGFDKGTCFNTPFMTPHGVQVGETRVPLIAACASLLVQLLISVHVRGTTVTARVQSSSYNGFDRLTGKQQDDPRRLSDDSLWVMFESTMMLVVTDHAKAMPTREAPAALAAAYGDFQRRFDTADGGAASDM